LNIQWQNSENVKVNNIDTSAILEDADSVLNYFADKYIITKYKLATGDLVEYAGITYIVVSQIDRNYENRKVSQINYRARIRQADFNIKFIIDDELEIIDSVIEGQTFTIAEDKLLDYSTDKIIVTIQDNNISSQLKKEDRFIKFGRAFKAIGIDKTKKGLITLICQETGLSHNDDMINEIANRWIEVDGKVIDRLPHLDDQEPIDPEIPEPEEPEPEGATYSIEVIEKQYETDTDFEIWMANYQVFQVAKIVNGEEVETEFEFELNKTVKNVTLTKESDNSCKIAVAQNTTGKYDIELIVKEEDEIILTQDIKIEGR